jgi:hypothetical protein
MTDSGHLPTFVTPQCNETEAMSKVALGS